MPGVMAALAERNAPRPPRQWEQSESMLPLLLLLLQMQQGQQDRELQREVELGGLDLARSTAEDARRMREKEFSAAEASRAFQERMSEQQQNEAIRQGKLDDDLRAAQAKVTELQADLARSGLTEAEEARKQRSYDRAVQELALKQTAVEATTKRNVERVARDIGRAEAKGSQRGLGAIYRLRLKVKQATDQEGLLADPDMAADALDEFLRDVHAELQKTAQAGVSPYEVAGQLQSYEGVLADVRGQIASSAEDEHVGRLDTKAADAMLQLGAMTESLGIPEGDALSALTEFGARQGESFQAASQGFADELSGLRPTMSPESFQAAAASMPSPGTAIAPGDIYGAAEMPNPYMTPQGLLNELSKLDRMDKAGAPESAAPQTVKRIVANLEKQEEAKRKRQEKEREQERLKVAQELAALPGMTSGGLKRKLWWRSLVGGEWPSEGAPWGY